MYRLKYRFKSGAGIAAVIIGTVLVLLIPYIAATQGLIYDLPAAPFAAGQILLPLFFALFTYRTCPLIQQMRAFLVTCSLIGWFGCLANSNPASAFQVIQQDWLLHFNAVTFGAMNLAGLIAATNLMQAEQMSSFADTKVAEAQLERLKAVKVDPETQAKWEKAAAHADRSTDGRSLRSTMTNLKAISLTEPGQELKPTMRDSSDKERTPAPAGSSSGDNSSLANMLNRMDDLPMADESAELTALRRDPALAGNSFINEASDPEPAGTGASLLDSILSAKIMEEENDANASLDLADLGLPAEEAETIDVAALLDSFPDDSNESTASLLEGELELKPEPDTDPILVAESIVSPADESVESVTGQLVETDAESALGGAESSISEEKFEVLPASTQQIDQPVTGETSQTTRTSSFASTSSSRNSMAAMQPLHEGAASGITALSSDDTANFPVPNVAAQGFSSTSQAASPSNTNNKLAAMKRRNTSTFTKLNALSTSGTGTLKPPAPDAQNEPDSLRSLLDRLDDDKVEAPEKTAEEAAKPIEPPVELTIDTVFKEDGIPEVAAPPRAQTQTKAVKAETALSAAPSPIIDSVPASVAKEAKAEAVAEAAPLSSLLDRSLSESQIEDKAEAVAEASPLSSLLDRSLSESQIEDQAEAIAEASPLSSLLDRSLSEGQIEDKAEAVAAEEEAESELSVDINAIVVEEEVEEVREAVFGQGVDSDIDNLFSELAPPEAQLEVGQTEVAASKPRTEEPITEEPIVDETSPMLSEASEALFGGGVDGEIDTIFSELAPADAQKEVGETYSTASTTTTYSGSPSPELSLEIPGFDEASEAREAVEASETNESINDAVSEEPSSLFDGGLDSEIDNIFSELAPAEAQKEVKDVLASNSRQDQVATASPSLAESFSDVEAVVEAEVVDEGEQSSEGGLFGESLGQELDNIFSSLTEGPQLEVTPSTLSRYKGDEMEIQAKPRSAMSPDTAQSSPAAAKTPGSVPIEDQPVVNKPAADKPVVAEAAVATTSAKTEPAKYKEVKEFGRLSSKPSTAKFGPDTGGTMKTIGKLLLDVQAVENIIKSGENRKIGAGLSTAKIISAARGEGIRNILNAIDTYDGVAGSLIVGHDGLVIASTVGTGWDKDMLGALSTALLSTSNLATKKLEIGKLRQMVMLTELANGDGQEFKTTVLTDVDVGILAVFLEKTDLDKIDGLLDTIHSTIHGG